MGALAGQHEDLSDYLSGVRLVWARRGAYERLVEEGVEARPLAMLGRCWAWGDSRVNEVIVNGASWEINEGEGLLALTTPVRTVSVVNAQRDRRAGSSRRADHPHRALSATAIAVTQIVLRAGPHGDYTRGRARARR